MRLYDLRDHLVLRFQNKACDFLKAYTSNTLDKPRNAFLTSKGNIVVTCYQVVISPDKMLIVIEKSFYERLRKHLGLYLDISGVTLEIAQEYHLYYNLDKDYVPERGEIFIEEGRGQLIGRREAMEASVSDEAFTRFRLATHLPMQGIDYDEEMLLNIGNEEFVSYTKGCYLGQEIIARVHYKARPPRRLVARYEDECTGQEAAQMTSKVRDQATGRVLGFVFVPNEI